MTGLLTESPRLVSSLGRSGTSGSGRQWAGMIILSKEFIYSSKADTVLCQNINLKRAVETEWIIKLIAALKPKIFLGFCHRISAGKLIFSIWRKFLSWCFGLNAESPNLVLTMSCFLFFVFILAQMSFFPPICAYLGWAEVAVSSHFLVLVLVNLQEMIYLRAVREKNITETTRWQCVFLFAHSRPVSGDKISDPLVNVTFFFAIL